MSVPKPGKGKSEKKLGSLRRLRGAMKVAFPEARLKHFVGEGTEVLGYTTAEERLFLFDEACLASKTGRFVEIGSYLGATAVVLAEAARRHNRFREGKVYCIDSWNNDAMREGRRDTYAEFCRNVEQWRDLIVELRGHSGEIGLPFDGECDLVFIDGDHSYEGTRTDADRFAHRVRVGGRLVMHDHFTREGVARVVGELLTTGQWAVSRAIYNIISLERRH